MLPRGRGRFQKLLQTWSPLQERCCASHDSKAHAACFTLHTVHLHQPHALPKHANHTLPPLRARSHAAEKNSVRPCASCRHYTIVIVRTSRKYDKMWLVGLRVLPWLHLPVSRPCRPCIAMAAGPLRADECILCRLSPHLHVSIDPPWMQKSALIHYTFFALSFISVFRSQRAPNQFSPPQNRNSNSRPTFAPFSNGAAGKGLYTNKPCLSWTRVNAMYAVNGPPVSPMCMSMTTPSLQVCPWAAWAVVANPGANGNCFRVTRSTGHLCPLSKYGRRHHGASPFYNINKTWQKKAQPEAYFQNDECKWAKKMKKGHPGLRWWPNFTTIL